MGFPVSFAHVLNLGKMHVSDGDDGCRSQADSRGEAAQDTGAFGSDIDASSPIIAFHLASRQPGPGPLPGHSNKD